MALHSSINLFDTNKKVMSFFGTWPKVPMSLWTLKNKVHAFLIVFFFLVPFLAFAIFKTHGSMFELSSCLSEWFAVMLGMAKFMILVFYQNELVTIIDDLNRFFKKADREDATKGTWKWVATTNSRIVKVFEFTAGILLFVYSILPAPFRVYSTWKSGNFTDLEYSIHLYFGPIFHNNFTVFAIMTAVTSVTGIYFICFAIANDTLFIAFIYDTSIAFECVGRRLRALKARQGGMDSDRLERELGEIIDDHAACIDIAEKVEDCLNAVMLFQYIGSLGNICFQMMQYALIQQNMAQFFSLLLFTVEDQIQMFGYYYFADRLATQSEAIAYDVYDLEWYGQPVQHQKAVRRILERAQQPQRITAGKFFNVTLETYGKFVNTTYTVFTFFRSFIDQK